VAVAVPAPPAFDVAIVGGGVIGAACAYALSAAAPSLRLALVERAGVGMGTTRAAAGLATPATKRPGLHMQLAAEGLRLHEEWHSHLGGPRPHRCGVMLLLENEAQAAAAVELADEVRRFDPWVRPLRPEALRTREPNLQGNYRGAIYSPSAVRLDPVGLAELWVAAAVGSGTVTGPLRPGERPPRLRLGADATGLEISRSGWRLATSAGDLTAAWVVLAAGLGTVRLLETLGRSLPLAARRGQGAVTKPLPGYIRTALLAASYLEDKFDGPPPHTAPSAEEADPDDAPLEHSFSVIPDPDHRLWIGSTRRFDPRDGLRSDERVRLLHGAMMRLRGFDLDLVESEVAGLRPWSPDGLPVVGPVAGLPGLLIAAGHEGDGVGLAPITGQLIAEMVLGRPHRVDPYPLRPDRFAGLRGPSRGGSADDTADDPSSPARRR
jgi:sarcosine oxidase subunit beta